MAKRTRFHLFITLAALALSIALGNLGKDRFMFDKYARQISDHLSQQEKFALDWLAVERLALLEIASGNFLDPDTKQQIWERSDFATQEFTLFLHRGDSIIFWNNNKALPAREELAQLRTAPERSIQHLPTGSFYALRQPFEGVQMTLLIPIRFENFTTGHRVFPANPSISGKMLVVSEAGDFPIIVNGQAIGSLSNSDKINFVGWQWATFLVGLVFIFLFFNLVNKFSMWAAERFGSTLGSAALLLPLALFLGAVHFFQVPEHFSGMGLFSKNFITSSLGDSLGVWLLNILVLLWLMVFFHREFSAKDWGMLPTPIRVSLAVVFNLALMMSVVMTIRLFKELMYNSAIVFDFDNILNLNRYSLVALLGIILILAGLFLFSHRMMLTIFKIDLSRYQRMLSAVISGGIIFVACRLFWEESLEVYATGIVGFALVYVVAFDFFIEGDDPGFDWIVSWLFIFSFFAAMLLYWYNQRNDYKNRLKCAIALTEARDTLAEAKIDSFEVRLAQDSFFDKTIRPIFFDKGKAELQNFITRRTTEDPYIFQHYAPSIYIFDKDQNPVLGDQGLDYNAVVEQNWNLGKPLRENLNIKWKEDSSGSVIYMLHRPAFRRNQKAYPVDAYIFFRHDYPELTKVYSSLFYQQPFKNLPQLNRFDYAVYRNGRELIRVGSINHLISEEKTPFPPPNIAQEIPSPKNIRTDVIFTNENGMTAIVGRHIGGRGKYFYLFSSLFTLLSLFMMALGGINSKVQILPEYYKFYISTKGSLAKRIQIWTVALIVATFFAIGICSYWHFRSQSEDSEFEQMDYRSAAMANHLDKVIAPLAPGSDTLKKVLPEVISPIASSFSTDVNLYDRSGNLIYTTQSKLQQAGILSQKINAAPFLSLNAAQGGSVIAEEQVGIYKFQARYSALLNKDKQLLGFISVPYYLNEGATISSEVSDFLGILATIYVFLLFVASSVAFNVAKTIISPIREITQEIVNLRKVEETKPLEYHGDGQDELSELIGEYNEMVVRLLQSQQQLVKFERDAAWRTMASQVAHDIKNGLSPMRLTAQQLERVSGSNDLEKIKDYLKTAIARLIKQIDALAYIASEFSMLSKLEIGRKQEISFNAMVDAVFGMYSHSKEIDFQISMPDEEIFIQADEGHLMRVPNNLAINAVQAIPSDRRGIIRVAMYLDAEGRNVVLKVQDNGGGIPEEVIPRLFEPNFTTKTTGSGLGLAISKRIVEAHDGTIYFETKQDVGTSFFVVLPVSRVS